MTRQVNDAGIALLEKWEGKRNTIYKDKAGNPSIGIGHKILPGEDFSKGLTDEQVVALFQKDCAKAESIIDSNIDIVLNDNQYAALVSLVFNCGAAPLCDDLGDYINDEDFASAADEWLKWDHIHIGNKPVVDNTLLERRQDERKLFLAPEAIA